MHDSLRTVGLSAYTAEGGRGEGRGGRGSPSVESLSMHSDLTGPEEGDVLSADAVHVLVHEAPALIEDHARIVSDAKGSCREAWLDKVSTLVLVRGIEFLYQQLVTGSGHLRREPLDCQQRKNGVRTPQGIEGQ